MTERADSVAGLILAAGRSSRMGGQDKSQLPLAGRSLIRHVADRLQPQVARIFINGPTDNDCFATDFDAEIIADVIDGFAGPLIGLYSALRNSAVQSFEFLQVVPCDGPFLPAHLVTTLRHAISNSDVACPKYANQLQPTFALWKTSIKPRVDCAVETGQFSGFKAFMKELNTIEVNWPAQAINPFFNINTAQDLKEAEALLACAT